MSDLPWIVKEFLLKLTVNPDCYTFVVMTSNNGKSGNSFVSLSQALSRSGANLSAVFDLQMPGNCLISSEQENLERLKKAPERLKSIISFIKERKQTLHLTEVCQKKILLLHRIFMEDIPVQPVMPVFTGVPRMLPCLKFHF